MADPQQFRPSREFAAWPGLTPLQNSSGGKERRAASARWETTILQAACCRRHRADPARQAQAAEGGSTSPSSAGLQASAGGKRGDGELDGAICGGPYGAGRLSKPIMCRCWRDEPQSSRGRAGMIGSRRL
ncbi:transposase [Microvirga aerophila]|uniref:transposase n=1 Tax=Microvirga aerophila TaxID=670291 RepID=UPI0035A240F2